jgi:hypothetical protein
MTGMKARSRSDVALAEAVTRETGLPTTPWQIERWRQGGLLQPGGRSFPGSGSETTYSLEAHAQAVELANLSRCYRRQRDIALALFAKGLYVSDPVLKRALVGVFERVDKWIGPGKTDDELDDIDHRAQRIAKWSKRTKQGRMLQRRMHGRGASPEDMVAGVYYNVLHIFKTGEVTSDEGFDEFLDATGLRGLFTEQLNGAGPIAPEGPGGLQAFLEQLTLQGVAGRVQKSSMDELRESRDLMAILFPFFKNFATAARHLQQAPTGLGLMMMEHLDVDDASRGTWAAIGLMILPLMRTSGAQQLLEQVRSNAAFYQGLAELARLVPPEVVPAMRQGDPNCLAGLPQGDRAKIEVAARAVQALHAQIGGGDGPAELGSAVESEAAK